ncbi:MAG: hypothetical protein ACHP9T_16940, partial [Caulobacterales bacterium]
THTLSDQELKGEVSDIRVTFGAADASGARGGKGGTGGSGSSSTDVPGTGGVGGAGAAGGAGGTANQGTFTTGAISIAGGSFANFAGVQSASFNTGLGSLNQAGTSMAANANISFGGTGGTTTNP